MGRRAARGGAGHGPRGRAGPWSAAVVLVTIVLAACAPVSPAAGGSGTRAGREGAATPRAGVDLSRHAVPLDDVHFDTFNGGSVPLSVASATLIEQLRDRIPPLDDPPYGPVETGAWLEPDDLVLGYVAEDGSAHAYPHKILNFHEIVNDELAGRPVLVSYCPLCRSGVVYDRRVDGRTLTFGNTSALYENDLVMVDNQTDTYWWQVPGRAIVGELTGATLSPLPSTTRPWSRWRAEHPDTVVLSRDLGHGIDYTRDPFLGYADRVDGGELPFPVSDDALADDRLSPGTRVLGVELRGSARAYPLPALAGSLVNDRVGGVPVVVVVGEEGGGAAFRSTVDGRRLTFRMESGDIVDDQTDSRWDLTGHAVDGRLSGTALTQVPSRSTFWFAYVGAFPDADVHDASG